jgi:hypothetical protein
MIAKEPVQTGSFRICTIIYALLPGLFIFLSGARSLCCREGRGADRRSIVDGGDGR